MVFGSSSSSMLLGNEEEHENQEQDIHPKKRRNPRIPYPDAEIIALSPTTLMAKNRFICEICLKGFPREQNLQLHKRGHNLPWKLKQSTPKDEVKRKAYICPEPSCIHHNRSHSLGDLTGIKKHYSRKHGEKKYKCQKCTKMYAVQSDLKAHTKTCGKKEYQCNCGTFFSRHDSFISHRTLCEALTNGGVLKLPTIVTPIGSVSTQMSLGLPNFSTCIPSVQNLICTSPAIAIAKDRTSESNNVTGFNCYMPSLNQQNLQKYQGNFDARVFNNSTTTQHNMGTHMNSGNGEGSTAMMPQLSATTLLHKASLLGSTWSNQNSANNFAPNNATCFSSGSTGCTNRGFDIHNFDSNRQESNIRNYFSSSDHVAGPSMLNPNIGATYEQEDYYHKGVVSHNMDDEWNMSFQQSSGPTFTRDFLGVGGGLNASSDGLESTVVGRSFL